MGLGSYATTVENELARARQQSDVAESPALLADLLSKEFKTEITPDMVKSLIRRKWFRLSTLAHNIHGSVE